MGHNTTLRGLSSDTAAHGVAADLSQAIHEHRLEPGTKLGEDDLSDIYGVSRTIIRAALQSLAHDQLVDIQRNRGAFVAKPTPREAREVFEARELLEPRIAQSAALKSTPSDIAILRQHISDEHAAVASGDRGLALALSSRFHVEIARMADQTTIAGFVSILVARSSLIIALYANRDSALCESHAHHALVEAIADHNGALAQDLMQSHLVDLHSALDLRPPVQTTATLRDRLRPV